MLPESKDPHFDMPSVDDFDDDCCPNCGGDGVIYSCLDEIGCVDPESGCDLCERPCDWCRSRSQSENPL